LLVESVIVACQVSCQRRRSERGEWGLNKGEEGGEKRREETRLTALSTGLREV